MSEWQSVGPFKDYRLVINGWQVPLLDVRELDGGQISVTLDSRINVVLESIAEANRVIPFLADVIGACWGYGAHPMSDEWYEQAGLSNGFDRPGVFDRVPHPSLAPHRMREIVGNAEAEPTDE